MNRTVHQKVYKEFVKRLVAARDQSGLTQKQVAKAVKQKQPWVSKIESGERRVDYPELKELAQLYKVPVTFFDE